MQEPRAGIEIREVKGPADLAAFLEAAARSQSTNPQWVKPLRNELYRALDAKKSPLSVENDIRCFTAFRDGVPIGRIATIVNHAFLAKYENGIGHFGLIDGIDDAPLFAALLDTAAASLRAAGMRGMQGPYGLTINHECGLLVDGFDAPHVIRTHHAPAYYKTHMESAGCRKAIDLLAATYNPADSRFASRIGALLAKSELGSRLKTYGLSPLNWKTKFPLILALYNDAWQNNWGAVPISLDEGRMISDLMFPVSKPSWIRIAEWCGEPIAIVAQIPDMNEAIADLSGELLPFGWAKLMWRLHVRGPRRTRIPMIGVARKWRGTRTGSLAVSLLLAEAIEQAKRAGVVSTEISWMLETNHAILNLVQHLPARRTRRFRIYERTL